MIIRSSSLRQNPAYRPGNSPLVFCGLLLLAVACRTRVPEQVIAPTRPQPAPAEVLPSTWSPRPDLLAREYRVEQRARIVASADSSDQQTDSTSLVIDALLRHLAPTGMSGLIRSVEITVPGAPPSALPGLVVPYVFAAPDAPPGVQASPAGRPAIQDPCTSTAHVPLGALRDLLIKVPESVTVGRQWSDSGSFTTCRDGVRIEVSSRRNFRVVAYEKRPAGAVLLVTRAGQTTLRGISVRGDDTTHVEGIGTNSMQYDLDPVTGSVLSASGTGTLDVVVRGALKSQRARQTSATLISPRAP